MCHSLDLDGDGFRSIALSLCVWGRRTSKCKAIAMRRQGIEWQVTELRTQLGLKKKIQLKTSRGRI